MTDAKASLIGGLVVGGGVILLALVVWIFSSTMEARAYNRVTGSNVSTWDAMWVELRVQSGQLN